MRLHVAIPFLQNKSAIWAAVHCVDKFVTNKLKQEEEEESVVVVVVLDVVDVDMLLLLCVWLWLRSNGIEEVGFIFLKEKCI